MPLVSIGFTATCDPPGGLDNIAVAGIHCQDVAVRSGFNLTQWLQFRTGEEAGLYRQSLRPSRRPKNYLLERRMFRSPSNRRSHRANAGSASRSRPFLMLRRLARARLSTGCGDQTRQPRQTHDSAPAPERALATQPPSSRTCSIQDGDRCRQASPQEHTLRSPSPTLVILPQVATAFVDHKSDYHHDNESHCCVNVV